MKMKETARLLLHILQALMEQLVAAEERVWSSQEVLDRSIPRAAKRPLRLVARSVCLEAGCALTPEELTRGVLRAGYESSSSQLKYYLLRVLRQNEEFECTPDSFRFSRSLFELYAMYDRVVAESFDGQLATAYITCAVETFRACVAKFGCQNYRQQKIANPLPPVTHFKQDGYVVERV